MATATTIAPTTVRVIEKNEMIRVLHEEHQFSDRKLGFIRYSNGEIHIDNSLLHVILHD
jgi:hypothetical protein